MPFTLVLASGSQFRRLLLERLDISFDVWNANLDETPLQGELAKDLVARLAKAKASAFSAQQPSLIIGSDQVGEIDGQILGKPQNHQAASTQLRLLSGREVTFYTGLALFNSKTQDCQNMVHTTSVSFRHLNDQEITSYIAAEQPFHSCGSFQVEGLGISLVEKIESDDPTGLIGLPLIHLSKMLRKAGIAIPKKTLYPSPNHLLVRT